MYAKKKMTDYEKTVRIRLIEADMSIKDLADKIGVSDRYIYDILSGYRKACEIRKKINRILKIK